MAILAIVAAVATSSCRWPELRFGPMRTGNNTDETAIGAANVDELIQIFAAPVTNALEVEPLVSNGSVFVVDRDGRLHAFDAAGSASCTGSVPRTCAPKWTSTVSGPTNGTPLVLGDRIYVSTLLPATDAFDLPDSFLKGYAVDGKTSCSGTPKVCSPTFDSGDLQNGFSASPVAYEGTLYLGQVGLKAWSPAALACSTAPCPATWTVPISLTHPPALADDTAYLVDASALEVFDLPTCEANPFSCAPTWQAQISIPPGVLAPNYAPALDATNLYLNTSTGVQAYRRTAVVGPGRCGGVPLTCAPRWSANIGTVTGTPVVGAGTVFAVNDAGEIFGFDASTGATEWIGDLEAPTDQPLTMANGVLYAVADGSVFAFDAAGVEQCAAAPTTAVCSPIWTDDIGAVGTPTVANGRLYVPVTNGIVAYALPTAPA